MLTAPVAAPAAAGVNVIGTVVDAPGGRAVATGEPAVNCAEPLTANGGSRVIAKPLPLVTVIFDVAGAPAGTTPKLRLVDAVNVAAATPTAKDASPEQPFASVARIVALNEPGAVGMPDTVPAAEIIRPVGSAPADTMNA